MGEAIGTEEANGKISLYRDHIEWWICGNGT